MFVPDAEQRVDPAQIRVDAALDSVWGHCVRYSMLLPAVQMQNSYIVRAESKAAAVALCLWWLLEQGGPNILLSATNAADVGRV